MILLGLMNCGVAVASIWAIRQIVSLAQSGYRASLLSSVAIYGILLILSAGYSVWYKRYRVQFQVILEFEQKVREKLHKKSSRISNESFETYQANATIRMADGARQNLFRYVEIWISIVMAMMQAVVVVAYISSFQIWFLLLLPLSVLPTCLELVYQAKLWKKYYKEVEQLKWEESEYLKALTDEVACKESRLTRAFELLPQKWYESRLNRKKIENNKSKKMLNLRLILTPVELAGNAGGYITSVLLLYLGKIDFAGCSAGIAAYASLVSAFGTLAEMIGNEAQYRQMVQPFFQYWNLAERKGSEEGCSLKQEIRLDHVSFHYPDQTHNVIEDLSFAISKGEVVAVVGENGAGKTTLAKLILGIFQPSSGVVYYDNRDISEYCESSVHKMQSTVSQNFNRYKMTVEDNIAIGDFDKRNRQEIKQRFETYFADSAISLDTFLGKEFGGMELSGGQWQQLSCARGFYKNGDILVMDEATSAIDPLKEKAMYDSFKKELRGKTGVIITHRLGAVSLADRIIVLENGRMVQSGTHKQLIEEDGLYARMWISQTRSYNESGNK
jgi:ATP-binding cassette subfamily B protein